VLIMVDTLRPDRMQVYGHDRPTTPNLAALAQRGLRFDDVSSTSPWTLPAAASILTGLYPHRHGMLEAEYALARGVPTLATVLRERGYTTFAAVNSYYLRAESGLARGFDDYAYVSEWSSTEPPRMVNRGDVVLARALDWLSASDRRPFLLLLHFYEPHSDYTPKPAYRELFEESYAGPMTGATRELMDLRRWGRPLSPEDRRHLLNLYDAEIRQVDELIGRLLSHLEAEGLAENTLIVATADHGEEFGEHGGVLHGRTHYEEVIRVPLILAGPDVPAGRTASFPVSLVDVAPTVLGALGLDPPPDLDGLDLLRVLREQREPERWILAGADHGNEILDARRMLRDSRHKLLFDRATGESRLFDLRVDPRELNDIARIEPERLRELEAALRPLLTGAAPGDEAVSIPEPERERLRALGYSE
jgi:arylsulfatase A-like enzyme